MEAAGVPYKHLKRYILALDCDSCAAATGRRHNKVSTVRVEAAQAKRRLKAQRKPAAQQKSTSKQTDTVELEISPITDAQNPKMTITESLARFFEHTALANEFDYSTLAATTPNQGPYAHDCADSLRNLDDILSATTDTHDIFGSKTDISGMIKI